MFRVNDEFEKIINILVEDINLYSLDGNDLLNIKIWNENNIIIDNISDFTNYIIIRDCRNSKKLIDNNLTKSILDFLLNYKDLITIKNETVEYVKNVEIEEWKKTNILNCIDKLNNSEL